MWVVVPATLNPLPIMNCTCIGRKMARIPSFPHYTSIQEILRSIANLPGEHVEEVFQGIARMLQVSSVLLDLMVGTSFFRAREAEPLIARLPNRSVNLLLGIV